MSDETAASPETDAAKMFTPGAPIEDFSQDELHRERYARRLAEALLSYDEPNSLVLGLDGTWGTGKTSILNLVVKAMGQRKWAHAPIVVRFNPWYFSDQDNLLRQFFRALTQRLGQPDLGKEYRAAAEKLDAFADLLDTAKDMSFWAKIGSALLRFWSKLRRKRADDASRLDALKEQISACLVGGGRRVIVLIDDIDRLTKREVRLMFRLVKAVADFRFVTYVMAFDEGVVREALTDVGGIDFIDKIVNVPVSVPSFTQVQIQRLVVNRLNRFAEAHQEYDWDGNPRTPIVVEYLTRTFKTIRHLERMLNTLNFNGAALRNEVDYVDLIGLIALRATNPDAYQFVRNNSEYLLDTTMSHIDKERSAREAKVAIEAFIEKQSAPLREPTMDLLAEMFPRFNDLMDRHRARNRGDEREWNRDRRICSLKSFDAYFVFDVPEGDISAERVRAILAAPTEDTFSSDLRELIREGNDVALTFLERLRDHLDDENVKANARAIVKALLNLGDLFQVNLSGFPFKLDGHTLVMQLVYQITRRIPDENERYDVLRDALTSASESLYSPATTVNVEDQSHRRYEDANRQRDPSGEKDLVSDEHLDELEQVMRSRIEEWAADGRLANQEHIAYLLFRWRNWSDAETVSRYVLQELDDGNFVRLVVLMGRNQLRGLFDGRPSLNGSPISQLAPIESIRERLRRILSVTGRESVAPELLPHATILAEETPAPEAPPSQFQQRLRQTEPEPDDPDDDIPIVEA